ncbi:MAG: hypothetical protein A3J05_04585 [Candidatus Doudnabacteria bacterium RIFCSPLOWO2_02_FULL_48_13]|uniref:DUF192 domain-containing protein n=1 Tax=Candidatus Doudnabacteria bacterium RIFCSPLOWO2_02_FULL_48_13 TaxID=1817845 RepID=A0A1F5Q9A1_9BACT|nr:MAG: hypothetical protein A3J05_04585 [Candidatus Doudnabacteria bacterium RIFCSPLOWO2_02_FULL_48_13]
MIKFVIFIVLLLLGGGLYYLHAAREQLAVATLTIKNKEIQIEIADSLAAQALGLSGRQSLCADCGMLFIYDRPKFQRFTMRDMNFPLDMIFIDKGKIVEIREAIPNPKSGGSPVIIQSANQADAVLEVNDGFVWKNKIKVGDMVVLRKK